MKTGGALALLFCATASPLVCAQGYDPAFYSDLKWDNVGPDRGGRSIACCGVRTRPAEFYFGATGGGLWKSTNAGVSWSCVTDGFLGSSSVGAVAVSESSPDTVYIGTGERDIRGDISEGDGVYRSTDGGKSWTHVGLEGTHTISRIVIDPTDPNIVYVAALGHVYGPSQDRGVYKSTDGGKSWTKVLFESDRAGAVDLQMDPHQPGTLYASTWNAWRTPYFLNSGGAGSKLWKSTDAGATWKDLTGEPGMPSGPIGKICVSVSGANSSAIWASVEAKEGGLYESLDAGATWKRMASNPNFTQRAWYFSHIIADPKDVKAAYVLNVGAYRTVDSFKTWSSFGNFHSDNHDLWINPDDPTHMIESNDGGATVSTDSGKSWTKESFPTAQFYHVVADNHIPYRIYGCQQDNSSVRLSPAERNRLDHPNWEGTAGGEAGYIAVSPTHPDLVYGGNYSGFLEELDAQSGLSRDINPWPDNPMGHGAAELKHRIQWTFPIVFSPWDPNTLYTASQYLLRTHNRGATWEQISPDLTRNDKSKQQSSGGPITQDNTSIEYYDTIFTVAESPLRQGVIWAGSDDGLVHVTRDDGGSWQDVTPPDLPKWARVSLIEASPHDPATAYLAANNYQNDDAAPYLYRTHDYGRSWTKIVQGFAPGAFTRVCREDRNRSQLLYAGTEKGAYVSFDDGDHWRPFQNGLPMCPVHDLCLKDDDLIAATHGRSFWVLHHTSRLSGLTPSASAFPILYKPAPQMRAPYFVSVPVAFYLPTLAKKATVTVSDSKGEVVAQAEVSKEPGVHSANMNLGHAGFSGFPDMVLWAGYSRRIPVPPGSYTVLLDVDGHQMRQIATIYRDPRVPATVRDLEEQYSFSVQVSDRVNEANQAVVRIRDEKAQMAKVVTAAKGDAEVSAAADTLTQKLTAIEGEIYQYRSHSGEDPLNYPIKLNDKMAGVLNALQSGEARPSLQARQVFAGLSAELQTQLDALGRLEKTDLISFNGLLKTKSLPAIVPKSPALTPPTPRRQRGETEEEGGEAENG